MATKTKYRTNIMMPMRFVIFHLKHRMHRKTARSMRKRRVTEQPIPAELTVTKVPLINVYRSQGIGRLQGKRVNQSSFNIAHELASGAT